MSSSARYMQPAEAARRLGISAKALRLYERRGLLSPVRTAAGWRAYGPDQMARAGEIAALRALGLGLAQIGRALDGPARDRDEALAAHEAALQARIGDLACNVARVRALRADPARRSVLAVDAPAEPAVAFDLPWPWGGERFELRDIRALNFIIGPLGSGKTRFATRLAETLPDAAFLGLERVADDSGARRLLADPQLNSRVERSMRRLMEAGAARSAALLALLAHLEADAPAVLVIDMVEQGLDQATQEALIAHLRRRGSAGRPLFLLTRSSAILDLAAVGPDETILLCPANHSPPSRVAPRPGCPGYEAVATCLAPPAVRARTEGVIAWRSEVAH